MSSKSTSVISRFPTEIRYAACVLLAMIGFVIYDQQHWWLLRPDYLFGFFVPFFIYFVLEDRLPLIAGHFGIKVVTKKKKKADSSATTQEEIGDAATDVPILHDSQFMRYLGHFVFWPMALAGLVFFLFGAVYRAAEGPSPTASMFTAAGLAGTILGFVWVFSDKNVHGQATPSKGRWRLVFLFIFPALIWMLSAPTFSALEKMISTFLMNKVAFVVFNVFEIAGYPLIQEGSILIMPNGEMVGVEEACSGIRSLTACLFAGSFVSTLFVKEWWKKPLLIAASMGLAILGNLFRSLFLTIWAFNYGAESINGKVHDITGYAVMIFTFVGLAILLPIFNFKFEYDNPRGGSDSPNSGSSGSNAQDSGSSTPAST